MDDDVPSSGRGTGPKIEEPSSSSITWLLFLASNQHSECYF